MNIQGIHHVAYRCINAKQTVEFYQQLLGMDPVASERLARTVELNKLSCGLTRPDLRCVFSTG